MAYPRVCLLHLELSMQMDKPHTDLTRLLATSDQSWLVLLWVLLIIFDELYFGMYNRQLCTPVRKMAFHLLETLLRYTSYSPCIHETSQILLEIGIRVNTSVDVKRRGWLHGLHFHVVELTRVRTDSVDQCLCCDSIPAEFLDCPEQLITILEAEKESPECPRSP